MSGGRFYYNQYKIREICCRADGVYYISIEDNMETIRISPSFTSKVSVAINANGVSRDEQKFIYSKSVECIAKRMEDRKRGDL